MENGFVSPHLQEIAISLLDATWWYDWNRKRSLLLAGYAITAGDSYWPEAADGEYIRIGYTTEEGAVMENAPRALAAALGHERAPSRIGEDGRRPNARYRKKY